MQWRDSGVLLSRRSHGENGVIIEVFTEEHGRHAGLVRGGVSQKLAPVLQPGAQIDVTWTARLEEHLGAYRVEPIRSRAAMVMGDRLSLAGLNAICGLLAFALPEREAHEPLYERSITLLDLLGRTDAWPLAYLHWELALLEELGFGLDLTSCAATGEVTDLAFVSPRTGRAVSRAGAGEWKSRLLPLPAALRGEGPAPDDEILDGLRTTGHFLEHWLAPALGDRPVPAVRERLVGLLAR
ncbi:DNA repair protein RecO [Pelagovum pacificum]|uniref:DNA repair protein RecO n=1 Tax=Pelagovum pacificum TaxID=2588711 RepID=A0A5C5GBD9_9RHOB|nr:DNA repair protein RecO [Pelagovum pacificum]QQA42312.1 DNA repair protein RecO [Pelagovum pacificum]TNY31397.1 DNA repair protein RecO [Pelagovum pacificum]